jgi:hypothetical protein
MALAVVDPVLLGDRMLPEKRPIRTLTLYMGWQRPDGTVLVSYMQTWKNPTGEERAFAAKYVEGKFEEAKQHAQSYRAKMILRKTVQPGYRYPACMKIDL